MEERADFITGKWKDPSFRGCFTGASTLYNILQQDFPTKKFTKKEVKQALLSQPDFVTRITEKKKFQRRSYTIQNSFDTWSLDIAFMKKVRTFIGFLVCVDVGSRKIYTRLITNKRAATVKKKLLEIF